MKQRGACRGIEMGLASMHMRFDRYMVPGYEPFMLLGESGGCNDNSNSSLFWAVTALWIRID